MPTEEEQYQPALAAYYAGQEVMGGLPAGSLNAVPGDPNNVNPVNPELQSQLVDMDLATKNKIAIALDLTPMERAVFLGIEASY